MRFMRGVVCVLGLAAAALIAGCAGSGASGAPANAGSGPGKLEVVAAEDFWGSLAQQLGGDRVAVTSIISNPATDPHDYDPTPQDAQKLASAQFAIVNGIGYDDWAPKLLAASPAPGRAVLTVGDALGIGGEGNPHQWYSPTGVQRVIDQITLNYKRLRPQDAPFFDAQHQQLEAQGLSSYKRLIADIRNRYAGTPIGASESIVAPLADDLGLKLLTPPSLDKAITEGTDPTAADKQAADTQLSTHQDKIWVLNTQNATPDVQRLTDTARRSGIPVVEVTETPDPGNLSFEDWQVHQLTQLEQALHQATGR